MKRFRQGMLIVDRQRLRVDVYKREIANATRRAETWNVCEPCRDAMAVTHKNPVRARELHATCVEEQSGGRGCMCLCQDKRTGEVSTGVLHP
jgi:hypothetical protein